MHASYKWQILFNVAFTETLRLYPPGAAVDRVCVQNYTLMSDPPLELHPGDNIMIPIYGLHHDPNYYPDPDRFDPERFSDDNKHNINPVTYMPFGIGPRSCIGEYYLCTYNSKFSLNSRRIGYNSPISLFRSFANDHLICFGFRQWFTQHWNYLGKFMLCRLSGYMHHQSCGETTLK
jgi:hypothetical protein